MRYLTKKYWKNFKKDGKLFENLSKSLIEYEYNVKDFFIMGGPNDEGSDITKKIELLEGVNTEIWAQCKYHKKSLSFDDISYTLLMAYIRNTNQILVFSYSRVTKDFMRLLDEYRLRTGKSVIIYSDEKLEKLIFKHKEKLKEEHKEFFEDFPQYIEDDKDLFRYDYQVYVNGVKLNDKNSIINLNSICEVVITVTNNTNEIKHIEIKGLKNKPSENFIFLGNKTIFTQDIAAFESYTFIYHIKLSKFIKSTSLPSFIFIYNNQSSKISSKLKISCRWLADTTLIGTKYYRAIDNINAGIKMPSFTASVVYGKSGVGKSRILKESISQGIICNKKIINVDSDKKNFSCKTFMELLSSKITQLPFFNTKIDFLSDDDNSTVSFASRVLYKQNVDFTKEWEMCSNFLTSALMQEKYILILDNLQHFDKLSLQIIEKTIDCLSKSKCETNILFGINTDYVYEGSYFYEFFCRLKNTASNNPETYSIIELKGFEQEDAELYIRECLSYRPDEKKFSVIDYENTIKKMAQHCNNNPFYLQHYLLYLEQEDIIRFGDHTLYYFHDIEKFYNSFQEIPSEIESLISLREKSMFINLKDNCQNNYVNFIQLLNITKSLPQDLFYEIINDKNLLDKMFDLGFISMSDDNIIPIHSFFTLYYNANYPINNISKDLLEKFNSAIIKLDYMQTFPLPFYWSKYRLQTIDSEDAMKIVEHLSSGNYDCIANQYCFDSLCRFLNVNIKNINIDRYITAYGCLCAKIDESIGLKVSVKLYDYFVDLFIDNIILFNNKIDDAISIIVSYLIHLVNLEKYDRCFERINSILKKIELVTDTDALKIKYQTNRCKIMIYNRNDMVQDAIDAAEENLGILNNEKLPLSFRLHNIYSAKRSIGNTFFYSTQAQESKNIIANSWNDSFNTFVEINGFSVNDNFSNQPKVAAAAKGLAADMITGEQTLGDDKLKFFINAFDHMNMIYYEMQIRLLVAMYLIWKYSDTPYYENKLSEIIHYIDQSIDIAAIYGRRLTTINAFQLKGVAYFLNENYSYSAENYCIAADMLSDYISSTKDYDRWDYFWVDMARAIKKSHQTVVLHQKGIANEKIYNKIKKIVELNNVSYDNFESSYSPITALTDKNYCINFPKI